jgi:hypothetical protein
MKIQKEKIMEKFVVLLGVGRRTGSLENYSQGIG